MYDVFISYSTKDQRTADAVVNYLESARVKCWIAYRDADAGALYAASIIKAVRDPRQSRGLEFVNRSKRLSGSRLKAGAYLIFCVNALVPSERHPFLSKLNGKLV